MEIITKKVDVYIIGDKQFLDMEEAKKYQNELENKLKYKYYRVRYAPDLTEGRGYYKSMVIACQNKYVSNAIIQYLVSAFGNPISLVQGVSAMDSWILGPEIKFDTIEALEYFLQSKVSMGIGDYTTTELPEVTYIDSAGKKLLEP